MATHSSILARKTPWSEKSGGQQYMGSQIDIYKLDKQQRPIRGKNLKNLYIYTHTHTHTYELLGCIPETNTAL